MRTPQEQALINWCKNYEKVQNVEIRWDREILSKQLGSDEFKSLRFEELLRAEWPNRWLLITGTSHEEASAPADLRTEFSQAIFGTAGGECVTARQSFETRVFDSSKTCLPLDSTQIMLVQGGPLLIGRWLWDRHIRSDLPKVDNINPEGFDITVSFPVSCKIAFETVGSIDQVRLKSITFLREGKAALSIDYKKYFVLIPEQIEVPTQVEMRFYRENSSDPRVKNAPSVRHDFVTGIEINKSYSDSDFLISLEGYRQNQPPGGHVQAPQSQPGVSGGSGSYLVAIGILAGTVVALVIRNRAK